MTTRRPAPVTALRRPATVEPDANALELFARIATAGSFAQAARSLGLTRAAVSRRVAGLEAQLGMPLFVRTTRALGLTEAGRGLAGRARAVLEAAELARRGLRARGAGTGLAGTLRLTSVTSFGQAVLGPLLAGFQARHPQLRIELRFTNRRVDLLREDIDLAFRLTSKPPEDCIATPVLPFAVRAYAAPAAGLPLAAPQALAGARCLLFGAPTDELATVWRHDDGRSESVTVQPVMVGDDLGTLQAVARAGGGIVLLPDFCAGPDLERGALVDALPGWQLPLAEGSQVQALTLLLAQAPESARALVRYVRDALAAGGSSKR